MGDCEKTFNRPPAYNLWRRELNLPCIDIDMVEVRDKKPVALFGITQCYTKETIEKNKAIILERTGTERAVLEKIAMMCAIPAYYVIHSADMEWFLVIDLTTMHEIMMAKDEYKKFIRDLKI